MVFPDSPSRRPRWGRRRFLAALGQTAAVVGGVGSLDAVTAQEATPETEPGGEQPERQVVIPTVAAFSDNYVGQFLTLVQPMDDETPTDVPIGDCQGVGWPSAEAMQFTGQLTDRRSDQPIAVRVPVSLDGREEGPDPATLFVINDASECADGEFVHLDIARVTLRSLAPGEPGPTVADDGPLDRSTPAADGPGFGLLAGAAGVGGALLARSLRRRE